MGKTIVRKIFDAHCKESPFPGTHVLTLDRVFCHEISTPPAILELLGEGKDRVFDPARIAAVIDHVVPAKDARTARQGKILRDWAARHGVEFFDAGKGGVCHALFPEQGFVRPGMVAVIGDSHACTMGALGSLVMGVGTAELSAALVHGVSVLREPPSARVTLQGKLPAAVFAKDLTLHAVATIGTHGAADHILEFAGPGLEQLSMEGRLTLCNMAAEMGAWTAICGIDGATIEFLWPHLARDFATPAEAFTHFRIWNSDPDATYEREWTLDATGLEPQVTWGYRPDQVKPVSQLAGTRVDQVFIGSCSNGRLEDLRVAARILKGHQLARHVRGIVTPATRLIHQLALKEGLIEVFTEAGFSVTPPSCSACPGLSNGILAEGEVCASTTNRNFAGRMGPGGMVHLMSPATAAASAIVGSIADPREFWRES